MAFIRVQTQVQFPLSAGVFEGLLKAFEGLGGDLGASVEVDPLQRLHLFPDDLEAFIRDIHTLAHVEAL